MAEFAGENNRVIARIFVSLILCVLLADAAGASGFSSEKWKTIKKGANWSRQTLMEQFCTEQKLKDMERSKIIVQLGEPEISLRYAAPGPRGFTDKYQISPHKGTFEIQYGEDGRVDSYSQSAAECISDIIEPAPAMSHESSSKKVKLVTNNSWNVIGDVEKEMGPPERRQEDIAPNFPTPLRSSSYWWPLSNDSRQMLWVRTSGHFSEPTAKRHVDVVCLIELSKDCPTKPLPPDVGKMPTAH